MQVHPTTDSESLLSPTLQQNKFLTPIVLDGGCGARSYLRKVADNRMPMLQDQVADLAAGNNLKVTEIIATDYARLSSEMPEHDVLFPTPNTMEHREIKTPEQIAELKLRSPGGYRNLRESVINELPVLGTPTTATSGRSPEFRKGSNPNPVEFVEDLLLPTVTTQDAKNNAGKSQFERNTLPLNAEVTLLPTVQVDDAKNTGHNQSRRTTLASEVWQTEKTTNWGKFEPAIRRWEELTRPAPAPTKPDGKDGNHRLSAEFTEWMMGLPEGWVTAEDIGLKRNDQLKACGNGVVPQQAELALRILLDGLNFESTIRGGLSSVLPTPTVMDQRDGKYLRTVAIKNLDKGVNRGLNLNNVVEAIGVDWQDGDTFQMIDGKLEKRKSN